MNNKRTALAGQLKEVFEQVTEKSRLPSIRRAPLHIRKAQKRCVKWMSAQYRELRNSHLEALKLHDKILSRLLAGEVDRERAKTIRAAIRELGKLK